LAQRHLLKRLVPGTFARPKSIEEGRVKLKPAPEVLSIFTDGDGAPRRSA
jgi:hypothetical protein